MSGSIAKRKVLIVDDEPAFTKIVKLTLEGRGGYEVCPENNSLNAMATARRFCPDIIILDVVMPALDGGEVMSQLQADPTLQLIPAIFLTAIVPKKEGDAQKVLIGGHIYLAKPINANELARAIEEHLGLEASSQYTQDVSSCPSHWLREVKKFTVRDEINPKVDKASTVVTIYYRHRWTLPRKLTFTEEKAIDGSIEWYKRPPEAQALVEKLKQVIGGSSSTTNERTWERGRPDKL